MQKNTLTHHLYFIEAIIRINPVKGSVITEFSVFIESHKDADNAWAMYIPNAQVLKINQEDAGNEHVASKPELLVTDPGVNADSTEIPSWAIAVSGDGP